MRVVLKTFSGDSERGLGLLGIGIAAVDFCQVKSTSGFGTELSVIPQ